MWFQDQKRSLNKNNQDQKVRFDKALTALFYILFNSNQNKFGSWFWETGQFSKIRESMVCLSLKSSRSRRIEIASLFSWIFIQSATSIFPIIHQHPCCCWGKEISQYDAVNTMLHQGCFVFRLTCTPQKLNLIKKTFSWNRCIFL